MKISSLNLSHVVFPIETREKIVFSKEQGVQFLRELKENLDIEEALLLSTCNRTEFFLVLENEERGKCILDEILKKWSHERNFEIPAGTTGLIHGHLDSVGRLLRVSAGLESQLLGESEILGQVRDSIELSEEAGVAGPVIRKLWEKALRCGKRVRSETSIGDGALSLAYGALRVAKKIHGDVAGLRYCLVGAGEVSELVLKNLQGIDQAQITILNRSTEHAEHLGKVYGASVAPFENLEREIAAADVVISSTSSKIPIIDRNLVSSATSGRSTGLLLVDLGVPRDIDPSAKNLPNVFLYNLDDLARLIEDNLSNRRSAIPAAEEVVQHETRQFENWLGHQQLGPAIRSLRRALEQESEKELDLLKDEVDDEMHQKLTRLLTKLIHRVLHRPTKELRSSGGELSGSMLARFEEMFQGEDREDEVKS